MLVAAIAVAIVIFVIALTIGSAKHKTLVENGTIVERNVKKQFIELLAMILAATMVLSGCGSKGSSSNEELIEPVETTEPNAEPTAEPTTEPTAEPTAEPTPQIIAAYDFSPIMAFSEGLTWATYDDGSGSEKYVIIDEEGNLIYSAHDDASVVYRFLSDGYAYYTAKAGDVIIDTTGREHLVTEKGEEESVSICGHGDGVFILRKSVKTYSQNGIYISLVDADGNTINPDQEIADDMDTDFEYFGEGIFRSYNSTLDVDGCFLNATTGKIYREYDYSDEFLTSFDNGKAYFSASRPNSMIGMPTIVTPDIFESESTYYSWHEALSEADEQSIAVPNPTLPDGVRLSDYGSFDHGLAPVLLVGADGRDYFTIVDESNVQQYEPIKLPQRNSSIEYNIFESGVWRDSLWRYNIDMLYSEGRLIYFVEDEDTAYLIDTSGNQEPLEIDFRSINGFKGNFIFLTNGFYDLSKRTLIDKIYVYGTINSIAESTENTNSDYVIKDYISVDNFSIEGKWKNIGSTTWGQVQAGAIVTFNGYNCNFFSPMDTYAVYKDGDNYRLDCTSLLADTISSTVKIVDENNIDIYIGSTVLELTRVE